MKRYLRQLTALLLMLGLASGYAAADIANSTGHLGPVLGGSGGTFTGGSLTSDTTIAAGSCFIVGTNGGKICQKTEGTPDQSGFFTGTTGNAWLIAEAADFAFDFAHAAATDPTLFIHSRNQATNQWVGLTHDGTNAQYTVGTGKHIFTGAVDSSSSFSSTSNDEGFYGGTSNLPGFFPRETNQTPDTGVLTTGSLANNLILAEYADRTFDFAHAAATDPTLFIHSHNQNTTQWIGFAHNGANGVISTGLGPVALASGSTVTAAAALPLPTGNVFHVTGNTNITSITSTSLSAGMTITLIFDGTPTFTDGNNLKLAGNLVATADDTITLVYDGTNFYETARAVN